MIVTKVIESSLNLVGDDMYSDLDTTCLKLLTEKYKGRNYKSCHIIEVVRILRRSRARMLETLDGKASVDVQFEVRAIVYIFNEVIHECTVIAKHPDRIRLKSPYAMIIIVDANSYMGVCEVSDVIPVRANKVRYAPGGTLITVKASPFLPVFSDRVVYKITGPGRSAYTGKEAEKIAAGWSDEEKKVVKFFSDLVYPYKKTAKIKDAFVDADKIAEGYVYVSDMSPPSRGAHYIKEKDISEDDVVVGRTAGEVREVVLRRFALHIAMMDGFRKTYPTIVHTKKYKSVWDMYRIKRA